MKIFFKKVLTKEHTFGIIILQINVRKKKCLIYEGGNKYENKKF